MDAQKVRQREAQCIQEQPAFCTAACPIHVDARSVAGHVRRGDFKNGFAVLARFVPFPSILARICDHPCERACKRGEAGGPLRIHAIERACADFGGAAPPRRKAATHTQRVAIASGGLSGLTAAVELAAKGYTVTVFEPGPRLLDDVRAACGDAAERDLAVVGQLAIEVRLETPAPDTTAPLEFDAYYDPAGAPLDPATLATARPEIFAGAVPAGVSPIRAVQDGKTAAASIDRFLQGASLTAGREPAGPAATRLYTDPRHWPPAPPVAAAAPDGVYSRDEAVREAERCFPCGCLECVRACEYLAHYKSYPKRYVREIYNNDCIIKGSHLANRMVNSCALCGLCAKVCPEDLSMADVCQEARESLVAKGKMPPSAHDFALRDFAFSSSDAFTLARHQPGFPSSAALFFPGCQLSGSSPDLVYNAYQHLTARIPGGVGLMLGCCGAPAHWAARADLFETALQRTRAEWERMQHPRVIVACSSCYQTFRQHLPDVPVESLWNVLETTGLPDVPRTRRRLMLHDPCSTRGESGIEDSVRRLLTSVGVDTGELNARDEMPCCGFGGLVRFAHPQVADRIVSRRVAQSDADYVTYCAMCRDSFARQGKRAWHLLDLIFESGNDAGARPDPGFSQRQENRARLKARFLRDVWREDMATEPPRMKLDVAPEVMAVLERRLILLDDIRAVIEHAERTGEKFADPATGRFVASYRPACVTYWVEYSTGADAVTVHNAYSHRMQVE